MEYRSLEKRSIIFFFSKLYFHCYDSFSIQLRPKFLFSLKHKHNYFGSKRRFQIVNPENPRNINFIIFFQFHRNFITPKVGWRGDDRDLSVDLGNFFDSPPRLISPLEN